jgi:hypothetical protein
MKFRTEIPISPAGFSLSHSDKIEMLGSCFVENISAKLLASHFQVDVNPFGVLYNPFSIANGLSDLINGQTYMAKDLFYQDGAYHSFSHHSRFSGTDEAVVTEQINSRIQQSSDFLKEASVLIITFGTANTYRLLSSGKVVSNCHKLPASLFREERLSVQAIGEKWNDLINRLQSFNPQLKILFTVSPIRHWKDGAHENQLNKATLLLAVNELVKVHDSCYYFPSYEIMMDDLRDYRFYAEDMIHPNQQAINYIWEKFGDTFFDKKTLELIKEYEKVQKQLHHRTIIS